MEEVPLLLITKTTIKMKKHREHFDDIQSRYSDLDPIKIDYFTDPEDKLGGDMYYEGLTLYIDFDTPVQVSRLPHGTYHA